MPKVRIRPAQLSDHEQLTTLRHALWPDESLAEHGEQLNQILAVRSPSVLPFTILVAEVQDNLLAGFLDVGLRSHAESCDTSHAVGYVEGWYVAAEYRRQGIGAALLAAAEDWARLQNCREMASDTQLHNHLSQLVHMALGFEEVERSVNHRKSL